MKSYEVYVSELQWRDVCYHIEAESEEEAKELALEGEGNVWYDEYNSIEKSEIIKIKEIV